MAKRKLTEAQVEALMADYYAWEKFNPDSEDATELAGRHGISKPTLYNIKREYERARADRHGASSEDLQATVRYLTEELIKARIQIATLEAQQRDFERQ